MQTLETEKTHPLLVDYNPLLFEELGVVGKRWSSARYRSTTNGVCFLVTILSDTRSSSQLSLHGMTYR